MNDQTCRTCLHFRQHYILSESKFVRVFCGHCTFSHPKTRRSFNKACEHYVFGAPDEDACATKEYLSKKLVEHFMSLELLPQIEDAAE